MTNSHLGFRRMLQHAVFIACVSSSSAWAQMQQKQVELNSEAFSKFFLRLDGRGITTFLPNGGGIVNAQYGPLEWERFCIRPQPDDTIAFESVAFPGVFLRLDGTGVGPANPNGGVVNAQWQVGAWERFRPRYVPIDKFAYESAAFRNVFLRFDGTGVATTFAPNGAGIVNAANGAQAWEEWRRVVTPDDCPTR